MPGSGPGMTGNEWVLALFVFVAAQVAVVVGGAVLAAIPSGNHVCAPVTELTNGGSGRCPALIQGRENPDPFKIT